MLLNVIWDIKLVLLLWPEKTTPSDQCTFWSGSWSTAVQKLFKLFVVYVVYTLVMLEWVTVCVLGRVTAERCGGGAWCLTTWFVWISIATMIDTSKREGHCSIQDHEINVTAGKPQHILSAYPLKTICLNQDLDLLRQAAHLFLKHYHSEVWGQQDFFIEMYTFIQQGHIQLWQWRHLC